MSFDWARYLILAQELVEQSVGSPNWEAKLRCAISRAYYAAYCQARNHLRDKERDRAIPESGEAHRYVRDRFKKGDRFRRQIGEHLNRLYIHRAKADYKDTFPKLRETAETDLELAGRGLANLRRLR